VFNLYGQITMQMGKSQVYVKRVSFWWRDNLKLLNCYKSIAHATAGQGYSILFWQDLWDGKILGQSYPHLYSFTNQENITLQSVLQLNDLHDLFHLPLSEEAYTQFYDLHIYLQGLQITNDVD
jgi:hypothetical protein